MSLLFKEIVELPWNGKESFQLEIKGRTFEVDHEGIKRFSDQSENSRMDLEKVIEEYMDKGEYAGFVPYNNFECSIRWRAI